MQLQIMNRIINILVICQLEYTNGERYYSFGHKHQTSQLV